MWELLPSWSTMVWAVGLPIAVVAFVVWRLWRGRRADVVVPLGPHLWFQIFHALLARDSESVRKRLTALARENADCVDAFLLLARLRRETGDLDGAIRLRQGLLLRPGLPVRERAHTLVELAQDFRLAGQYRFAEQALEELADTLRGARFEALDYERHQLALAKGDHLGALSALDAYAQATGDDVGAERRKLLVAVAKAALAKGDAAGAEKALTKMEVPPSGPARAVVATLYGELAELRGRRDEAADHYRQALRHDPVGASEAMARLKALRAASQAHDELRLDMERLRELLRDKLPSDAAYGPLTATWLDACALARRQTDLARELRRLAQGPTPDHAAWGSAVPVLARIAAEMMDAAERERTERERMERESGKPGTAAPVPGTPPPAPVATPASSSPLAATSPFAVPVPLGEGGAGADPTPKLGGSSVAIAGTPPALDGGTSVPQVSATKPRFPLLSALFNSLTRRASATPPAAPATPAMTPAVSEGSSASASVGVASSDVAFSSSPGDETVLGGNTAPQGIPLGETVRSGTGEIPASRAATSPGLVAASTASTPLSGAAPMTIGSAPPAMGAPASVPAGLGPGEQGPVGAGARVDARAPAPTSPKTPPPLRQSEMGAIPRAKESTPPFAMPVVTDRSTLVGTTSSIRNAPPPTGEKPSSGTSSPRIPRVPGFPVSSPGLPTVQGSGTHPAIIDDAPATVPPIRRTGTTSSARLSAPPFPAVMIDDPATVMPVRRSGSGTTSGTLAHSPALGMEGSARRMAAEVGVDTLPAPGNGSAVAPGGGLGSGPGKSASTGAAVGSPNPQDRAARAEAQTHPFSGGESKAGDSARATSTGKFPLPSLPPSPPKRLPAVSVNAAVAEILGEPQEPLVKPVPPDASPSGGMGAGIPPPPAVPVSPSTASGPTLAVTGLKSPTITPTTPASAKLTPPPVAAPMPALTGGGPKSPATTPTTPASAKLTPPPSPPAAAPQASSAKAPLRATIPAELDEGEWVPVSDIDPAPPLEVPPPLPHAPPTPPRHALGGSPSVPRLRVPPEAMGDVRGAASIPLEAPKPSASGGAVRATGGTAVGLDAAPGGTVPPGEARSLGLPPSPGAGTVSGTGPNVSPKGLSTPDAASPTPPAFARPGGAAPLPSPAPVGNSPARVAPAATTSAPRHAITAPLGPLPTFGASPTGGSPTPPVTSGGSAPGGTEGPPPPPDFKSKAAGGPTTPVPSTIHPPKSSA